ncbi:MAG: response regulator [Owenweeksia sp.]|nr:response regulator [Owenweeksia sp.]
MSELEPSTTASPSRLVARVSELKILMAEDNAVNQKLAMLLFKKLGLAPTIVATGVEAVKAATGTTFDLIFMDVYMPEMDGLEATRILKDKLGERVPIHYCPERPVL